MEVNKQPMPQDANHSAASEPAVRKVVVVYMNRIGKMGLLARRREFLLNSYRLLRSSKNGRCKTWFALWKHKVLQVLIGQVSALPLVCASCLFVQLLVADQPLFSVS